MAEKITFGEFITKKRQEKGLTIRALCRTVSLSPAYFSNMENGKRPAPSFEAQALIADALGLTGAEREYFFDLAAATKRERTLPCDVSDYINGDENVLKFLREASKRGIAGDELLELIK